MPVTEAQVNEALGSVRHPTLRRPLVDLGLVQRIRIDGGRVEVLVAALEDDDPDTAEVVASIREAVSRVPGAGDVAVPVVVLSPDDQAALGARLRSEQGGAPGPGGGGGPAGQRLGHEEGRPNAFTSPSSRTR